MTPRSPPLKPTPEAHAGRIHRGTNTSHPEHLEDLNEENKGGGGDGMATETQIHHRKAGSEFDPQVTPPF